MWNFKEEYDAVIVGSGAAGGIAAWVLVNSGLKVAMLEAGPLRDREKDFSYFEKWPYDDPYRGFKPKEGGGKIFTANDNDEPYTTPDGMSYNWFRARNVGGRTMFWGKFMNRFNAVDFKGYSADGHGQNWPISYQDIEPYYDKVERFVGVCGNRDAHPDLPDSKFLLPAVAPKCADIKLTEACAKIGIKAISARRAVLTKAYNGYKECYYCARCESGCHTDSFFNSAFRCVTPLLKKFPRRFTLISNAMARNVTVNAKGLASGVSFVDKTTGQEREVSGRVIVLACGTLETTRLMLLSQSGLFPQGIANSSGQVGRNFMEHLDAKAQATLPSLSFANHGAGDGIGGSHILIPWFGYDAGRKASDFDFVRGFHIEPSARLRLSPDKNPKSITGFGSEFKREVRRWYGTTVRLAAHGEMLPGPGKFVELDQETKDKWGMPVLKIHHPLDDNDRKMFKRIRQTYEEILTAAGAINVRLPNSPDEPGASIHEVGTAHMGSSAKDSVLNQFNQTWDVKNLFVVDGAAFTSGSHKNPTDTIMALSWRAAEFIHQQLKKGNFS